MSVPIDEYFLNLIRADDRLKEFEYDFGLGLISKSLDFKINTTLTTIQNEIKELYYPTLERNLLAHLLYKVGYIRFKKPLQVKTTLLSDDDVDLDKDDRFSDGKDLYLLDDSISLEADKETEVTLTLKEKYTLDEVEIKDSTLFFKIPLNNVTYKELVNFEVYKDDKKLIYSQNFVKDESEVSIEIINDGTLQLVILLHNEKALNLDNGDKLKVNYYLSTDTKICPTNLAIIEDGDYNLVCKNIKVNKNYQSPMSLNDMAEMIKFGRKNLGDICLNEDYRQFLYKNINNLKELKVWQEREENKEYNNPSISNINKVFCSYITTDNETYNEEINKEIKNFIFNELYGKEVIIREANLIQLNLSVIIKTNDSYSETLSNTIKNEIVGIYDDLHTKIDENIIYRKVFEILVKNLKVFSLNVYLSDKGHYKNNKFFELKSENINIAFKE